MTYSQITYKWIAETAPGSVYFLLFLTLVAGIAIGAFLEKLDASHPAQRVVHRSVKERRAARNRSYK